MVPEGPQFDYHCIKWPNPSRQHLTTKRHGHFLQKRLSFSKIAWKLWQTAVAEPTKKAEVFLIIDSITPYHKRNASRPATEIQKPGNKLITEWFTQESQRCVNYIWNHYLAILDFYKLTVLSREKEKCKLLIYMTPIRARMNRRTYF